MGIKNPIQEGYAYFITMTVIDWIDIFTKPVYKHIITESLKYCQRNKGLEIMAWVIMSNHIHMIARAKDGYLLSDILRDFKKFTSKKIAEELLSGNDSRKEWIINRMEFRGKVNPKIRDFKFWMEGNEAKEIHTKAFLEQKMEYIHNNPIRAEIVFEPHQYLYSSAIDYADGKGILKITKP
jgi:REP element-mobilizing transposase RayT